MASTSSILRFGFNHRFTADDSAVAEETQRKLTEILQGLNAKTAAVRGNQDLSQDGRVKELKRLGDSVLKEIALLENRLGPIRDRRKQVETQCSLERR